MSDKHPEIECYECGRLKTRLIWNSRCVTCTVKRLEANLEENNNLRDQLAALEEENERLKTRVAELVEVLKRIAAWPDGGKQYGQASIKIFAAEALAAYRKGGEA